jgi:hypothetical protein
MHLIHLFLVSSCVSCSIFSVYLVLSFLSNPYQAVLQRSKKSLELLFCLCCSAAMSLNFCVSLTTLSNLSSRSGCNNFKLAADARFSSWRSSAQLSACSRSASITMIAVFLSPSFWTVSRRDTCRHHVLMSKVSVVAAELLQLWLRHVDTGVVLLRGCHLVSCFLFLLSSNFGRVSLDLF